MGDDRWIVIPGWDKFQHRDAGRSGRGVVWIRDYRDQLFKDEFRELTFAQRGLLQGLRLEYASTQGVLKMDAGQLGRRLGQRVYYAQLEALANAGFIEFSASRPPALSQQAAGLEVEVEVEVKPPTPLNGSQQNGSHVCPKCGLHTKGPQTLADHIANVHWETHA